MKGTTISRVCIAAWAAVVAGAVLTPSSAPLWVRVTLAAVSASPIVAALLAWPVLIVRGLPEVTLEDPANEMQETRMQVLDGRDVR